jgi:hypothetical protein
MALIHVETRISGTAVHIRYADTVDPTKATEWVDVRVHNGDLKLPSGTVISEVEFQHVAAVKLAALRHVLGAIETEIARLRDQHSRMP